MDAQSKTIAFIDVVLAEMKAQSAPSTRALFEKLTGYDLAADGDSILSAIPNSSPEFWTPQAFKVVMNALLLGATLAKLNLEKKYGPKPS